MSNRTTNTQWCSSKYWKGCFTQQQIHNGDLVSIGGCFTEQQIQNGVLVNVGGDVLPNNTYTMVI